MVNIFLLFWRSHFVTPGYFVVFTGLLVQLQEVWELPKQSLLCRICNSAATAGSWKLLHAELDHWLNILGFTQSLSGNKLQPWNAKHQESSRNFFDHTYQAIHKELTKLWVWSVCVSLWGVFCVQPHRAAKLSFQVWHCSINSLWGTRSTWKTLQMTLEKWISICSEIGPRVWNRMCLWEIILGPCGFLLCSTLLFRKLTSPSTLYSLQRDMGILWEQTWLGC